MSITFLLDFRKRTRPGRTKACSHSPWLGIYLHKIIIIIIYFPCPRFIFYFCLLPKQPFGGVRGRTSKSLPKSCNLS